MRDVHLHRAQPRPHRLNGSRYRERSEARATEIHFVSSRDGTGEGFLKFGNGGGGGASAEYVSGNMNVKLSKDHAHYSGLREVDRMSVLESWMVSAMVVIVEGEYIYLGVRRILCLWASCMCSGRISQ